MAYQHVGVCTGASQRVGQDDPDPVRAVLGDVPGVLGEAGDEQSGGEWAKLLRAALAGGQCGLLELGRADDLHYSVAGEGSQVLEFLGAPGNGPELRPS